MVRDIRIELPRIGSRKLYHMLHQSMKEKKVGRDKLFDILRANHLLIMPVHSYHVTTNSHHRFRKHKNLIGSIEATRSEEIWVSDITYIGNRNRHIYFSLVTDGYSKKIMGYDLSDSLNTQSSLDVLNMANRSRLYKKATLIHHSDRGIKCCFDTYQKLLKRYHIIPSMTESYNPYANSVAERIKGISSMNFYLRNSISRCRI